MRRRMKVLVLVLVLATPLAHCGNQKIHIEEPLRGELLNFLYHDCCSGCGVEIEARKTSTGKP